MIKKPLFKRVLGLNSCYRIFPNVGMDFAPDNLQKKRINISPKEFTQFTSGLSSKKSILSRFNHNIIIPINKIKF